MNKINLVSDNQISFCLSTINLKPTQQFDLEHIEIKRDVIIKYFSSIFDKLYGASWSLYGCVENEHALIEIIDRCGNKRYLGIKKIGD